MSAECWEGLVSATWHMRTASGLKNIAVHASAAEREEERGSGATFEPDEGSTARCEVALNLVGHPQVRCTDCIMS